MFWISQCKPEPTDEQIAAAHAISLAAEFMFLLMNEGPKLRITSLVTLLALEY